MLELWSAQERFHCDGWKEDGSNGAIRALSELSWRPMDDLLRSQIAVSTATVPSGWGTTLGKTIAEFKQPNNVISLAFSPDRTRLASALNDGTVLIWDVSKHTATAAKKLEAKELSALWEKLASNDARKAFLTIHELAAASEQTPAFLRARLAPPDITAKQIETWIAELDDVSFAVRDAAQKRLLNLGTQAEPALRKAMTRKISVEQDQRIRSILSKINSWPSTPQDLQKLRAIEALEIIGSPSAIEVLEEQAARAPESWRAEEARLAVARLKENSKR